MKTVDFVYRFDPENPGNAPPPSDAEGARRALEEGNRTFARWMRSCRDDPSIEGAGPRHVARCAGLELGMARNPAGIIKQAPFAVVVGCSDARVPIELVFAQGFNDLFVVRVAGNVLGDVCLGSVDFAVDALGESVKALVVLGHGGCGAVTGAVDAYLSPSKFWSAATSPALRSILQRLFVSVLEAAHCLGETWGPDAPRLPGYRDALIETSIALNAAQAAFTLRQAVERSARPGIEVFYAVYNLKTHQVRTPGTPEGSPSDEDVNLTPAPANPEDLHILGIRMAGLLASTAPAAEIAAS